MAYYVRRNPVVLFRLLLPTIFLLATFLSVPALAENGPLVIIGGGSTPAAARNEFIKLAGGEQAIIAVIPQASAAENRGEGSVNIFKRRGVAEAHNVSLEDPAAAKAILDKATGIWFPGGSQGRLMKALQEADLVKAIQARHAEGVVCGGTSAGAAVMSDVMITHSPDKRRLAGDNTPTAAGLALAPRLIVDQHFIARNRLVRLLGAVMDHPNLVGVGIDEATAIVLQGETFRVVGKGQVIVIDPRETDLNQSEAGKLQSGKNLKMSLLKSGESYSLTGK